MTKFTPTDEQVAIWDVMKRRSGSLLINAYAGTGKTSTLELIAPEVRVPALALAFNKKIADDMKGKLPGNFQPKTFNGLGHGAWMRAIDAKTVALDDRKLGKLVTQVAKDRKVEINSDQWDAMRKMVSRAQLLGLVPKGSGPDGLIPDTAESWIDLADSVDVYRDEAEFLMDLAREVLEKDITLAKSGTISFDDQIYCSVMLGGKFPQFPVVFADEAQDLNGLNHIMFQRCVRSDGRVAVVGDPKQSIYAFRGATNDSMGKMKGLRTQDEWFDRELATTFRCPKVVVARQQEHVPGYRAWHTNVEGRFEHLPAALHPTGEEASWTVEDLKKLMPSPTMLRSTAILCRNTAPLLGLAFKLIRSGIGVTMLGRDLGKGLISLSKKIVEDDKTPADIVRGKVDEWEQKETALALANKKEDQVDKITDRAECLRAVLDSAQARDAGALRDAIKALFAQDAGLVVLGTIHRAKGLEWECVVHLDPWRLPSRQAKAALAAGNRKPMEQELNLRYVCETRSKFLLINANSEEFVA